MSLQKPYNPHPLPIPTYIMNSENLSKISSPKSSNNSYIPEVSEVFLQFSKVIEQQFVPHEEFQDFNSAIKFCHKALIRSINYFHFCYSNWLSNILSSIDKTINLNISSVKEVSTNFQQAIRDFEIKCEPLNLPIPGMETHKLKVRQQYFHAYLHELKEIRKSAKSIEDGIIRYFKFLRNTHAHFLGSQGPREVYCNLNSGMKASSKALMSWLEQIMNERIALHFKSIREYQLNVKSPNECLLMVLDCCVRKSTEDFVISLEKVFRENHAFLDTTAWNLEAHDMYSKYTRIGIFAKTMSSLYYLMEDEVSLKIEAKSNNTTVINHDVEKVENRNQYIDIPEVVISLTFRNVQDENRLSSSDTIIPVIGRQSSATQKNYEANKNQSCIVGHDLQSLLNKTEKELKAILKEINSSNRETQRTIGREMCKAHNSLITVVNQIEKSSSVDLELNRNRAEMYISYKIGQEIQDGKPKRDMQKYVMELLARTRSHKRKIKFISQLIIKFFEITNQEYSLFMKESISDYQAFQIHKAQACQCLLRACQREFAYMAEIAHAQLLNQAREIEMKNALTYGVGEFVKGMKWVDHRFIKALVDASTDSLQALQKFSGIAAAEAGRKLSLKVKSGDIQDAIQVINHHFTGFLLKSRSTLDEEKFSDRLKNITSGDYEASTPTTNNSEISIIGNGDNNSKSINPNSFNQCLLMFASKIKTGNKLFRRKAPEGPAPDHGPACEFINHPSSSSTPGMSSSSFQSSPGITAPAPYYCSFNPGIFIQDKFA